MLFSEDGTLTESFTKILQLTDMKSLYTNSSLKEVVEATQRHWICQKMLKD